MERLDKIISATGKKSRREVREMVRQGRVLVDGKPAPAADMKVDPQTAVILLDGEPLGYEKFTYVMLHKPAGVLTATEDRRQETVLDLLPPEAAPPCPVPGRAARQGYGGAAPAHERRPAGAPPAQPEVARRQGLLCPRGRCARAGRHRGLCRGHDARGRV